MSIFSSIVGVAGSLLGGNKTKREVAKQERLAAEAEAKAAQARLQAAQAMKKTESSNKDDKNILYIGGGVIALIGLYLFSRKPKRRRK